MKRIMSAGLLIGTLFAAQAGAADGSDDRLTLMANGMTLDGGTAAPGVETIDDEGAGGAIGWLHNFNANTIVGLRGEYQSQENVHWQFGTLSLAHGFGQADRRTNLYADIHEGSGKSQAGSYGYSVALVGVIQNITKQLSLQFEDKHIDIDTTEGNLPKIGVQYLWGPTLLTNLSYQHSVSGNLGTRVWSFRADRYGKNVNFIFGGAGGQATPVIVDLQTGLEVGGLTMKQGFIGVTKPFSRMDVTLLADYVEIGDLSRFTLTLNTIVRLRGPAR
jgi:hypothetical protein